MVETQTRSSNFPSRTALIEYLTVHPATSGLHSKNSGLIGKISDVFADKQKEHSSILASILASLYSLEEKASLSEKELSQISVDFAKALIDYSNSTWTIPVSKL